ncbi:hypothetical protein, partial [uncultured Desulfovibrio sp.]|uniref:hypothetical protein n=1 Tax=uncultured Desulfovibrio sp. TaxID=167968 RepID=UPI0026006AB5
MFVFVFLVFFIFFRGGKGPFVADCQLKGNRGLAQKRTPHDSCFANKHLNNEELSWGKNTLPK